MEPEEMINMYMKELSNMETVESVTITRPDGFYDELELEDKPVSNSPTCWGTLQDEEFVPAFTSVPKVPSGIYEVVWNRQLNQHTLKKQPFKTDELYQLPSYEITDILKDIQNFWDRRDKYKQYNFVHKRGILMYGEPGCGKSGIIQLISKQLIDNDGIILKTKTMLITLWISLRLSERSNLTDH
jgi:hypothetical protein